MSKITTQAGCFKCKYLVCQCQTTKAKSAASFLEFWIEETLITGGTSPVELIQKGRGHKVIQFIDDALETNNPERMKGDET